MDKASRSIDSIFFAALERTSAEDREAYLQEVCRDDEEMRRRVERLLDAHPKAAGSFLESPPTGLPETEIRVIAESVGATVGPYKLLEELGEGTFGCVYMAEQREPVRRKVAIKVLKPGMDTRNVIARFEAEKQALALMDHPNIARIFDAGATESGRPYFVMELVKGRPLTQYCDAKDLATAERLELFISVCHAVQHAHQKGIIHRDIKPSNVLVAQYDDRPVVKVIDFGVAKALHQPLTDKTLFTSFGQLVGTLLYMSPEQAELNALDVDTRSDVYSLGVLLYELLTGVTPFDGKRLLTAAFDEMRRIIREEEPPRPSTRITTLADATAEVCKHRRAEPKKLWALIHGDLDWIVMKALEKDRARRYDTSSGLAADIARYLKHEPVEAMPPSAAYRLRKFVSRRKALVATASAFAATLAGSTAVSGSLAHKNSRLAASEIAARREAEDTAQANKVLAEAERVAREKAERQMDRNRRLLYVADMNVALQAWNEANVARVVDLLERHMPAPGEDDLRGFEWYYLCHLVSRTDASPRIPLPYDAAPLGFSPDDRTLAVGIGNRTVKLFDVSTQCELASFGTPDMTVLFSFLPFEFSPDGTVFAIGMANGSVTLFDVTQRKEIASFSADGRIDADGYRPFAFSPKGDLFAYAVGTTVNLRAKGSPERKLEGHDGEVYALAFSRDARLLISRTTEETIDLWDVKSGERQRRLVGMRGYRPMTSSLDGNTLAFGTGDGKISLWDTTAGKEMKTWQAHGDQGRVWPLVFSPDGRFLVSSGEVDRTVKLWDTNGQMVIELAGHSDKIMTLSFGTYKGDSLLASASRDNTIRLWRIPSGQLFQELKGHSGAASAAFSHSGTLLASTGSDRSLVFWSIGEAASQRTLTHHEWIGDVAFSTDGRRFVSLAAADRFTLRFTEIIKDAKSAAALWDASTGKRITDLNVNERPTAIAVSSTDVMAVGTRDGNLELWHGMTKERMSTLAKHDARVVSLAFSPDSSRLASGSEDGTVRLWCVQTGRLLRTLPTYDSSVHALAFSQDGKMVAVGRRDHTLALWNLDSKASVPAASLNEHEGAVYCLAFSPDRKTLASGSWDRTIKIWDLENLDKSRATLIGHSLWVSTLLFADHGKTLISASGDRTIKIWDTALHEQRFTLAGHEGGVTCLALSPDEKTLISGSRDRTVRIWRAGTEQEAAGIAGLAEASQSMKRPESRGIIAR